MTQTQKGGGGEGVLSELSVYSDLYSRICYGSILSLV